MPVVAVINRKGGSGKSTLATQLAGCLANRGLQVMLGDVDRQQSSLAWLRRRGAQPAAKSIVGWAFGANSVMRPPAGITHVVLDTPGGLQGCDLARIVMSADAILIPSRFEPCGLTQLYGLRYGTVPIVARTGGLSDTIIDANDAALAAGVATGFQFAPVTAEALTATLNRALKCFRDPAVWRALQKRGMAADVSWQRPAAQYAALYRSLVAARSNG